VPERRARDGIDISTNRGPMKRELRLRVAGATDPGRQREINQDYFDVVEDLGLMVVADGVGGHAGGEVASKLAVDAVRCSIANPEVTWPDEAADHPDEIRARMLAAFASANRRVREEARTDEDLHGMATTLVAAMVVPSAERLVVAHAGDSRAYLLRGGGLERLTEDHRLVNDAVVRSRMRAEAIATLRPDMLTRAIGPRERVDTEVRVVDLVPGDVIALASDGLTAVVEDAEIAAVLVDLHDLGAAASALIDRANARGGPDNVTVCLGRWAYA
jgi:serine/threonine protein phosphatase PrpC